MTIPCKKIIVKDLPASALSGEIDLYIHGVRLCRLTGDTEIVIADLFAEIWRKERIFWGTEKDQQWNIPREDQITHAELLMLVLNNIESTNPIPLKRYGAAPPNTLLLKEPPYIMIDGNISVKSAGNIVLE